MKTKDKLQTTLDRLPYGEENQTGDLKVDKKLPEGVRSGELYKDIIRIAWPSFVELLLTQLVSMVDMMMVGSLGSEAIADGLGAIGAGDGVANKLNVHISVSGSKLHISA